MQETNYLSKGTKIFIGVAALAAFLILFNDDYLEHLVLLVIAFALFKIDYIIQRYKIVKEHPGIPGMIIAPSFLSFILVSIPVLLWWLDMIVRSIFSLNTNLSLSFTDFISDLFYGLTQYLTLLSYLLLGTPPSLGVAFAYMYYAYITSISLIILVGIIVITISGFFGYRLGLKQKLHFLTYPFILWIVLVVSLDVRFHSVVYIFEIM